MLSNILVLGTSVVWGQGLREPDKIHTCVKQLLEERGIFDPGTRVIMLAHSGATIGYNDDDSVDCTVQPRIHPEVPTFYPTMLQQLDEFDALPDAPAPDDVDLLLVEGGINDVSLVRILNPFITLHQLKQEVETHCYRHMKLYLENLVKKFPRSRIIVLAYYPPLTPESEETFLHALITALGVLPGTLDNILLQTVGELEKKKILDNCDLFATESTIRLQAAVDEVNRETKAESTPRVLLAVPTILPKNAAFAPEPYLFGVHDNFTAQDALAQERATACEQAGLKRTFVPTCRNASAAHPNPEGARVYAEAIVAAMDRRPTHSFDYHFDPGNAREITKDGIWFRDSEGRYALFRGMNFSVRSKLPPYLPILPLDVKSLTEPGALDKFRQELDRLQPHLDYLKQLGINLIRLVVIWKALEPIPNPDWNDLLPEGKQYLDCLKQIIDLCYQRGFFVLIDFHTDLAHELYGGDGFPDWALAIDDKHKRPDKPPEPSPKWMLRYYETPITTLDKLVRHTLQAFWRNNLCNNELTETQLNDHHARQVRTHFEKTIGATARYLANSPAILGYEPANEPHQVGIEDEEFERDILRQFYENVLREIRSTGDSTSFLFVEPRVDWATYDITGPEFKGLDTTKHPYTALDVENIADERTVFAFHFYDNNAYINGEPSLFPPNIPHGDSMHHKVRDWPMFFRQLKAAGTARRLIPFMTEFGGDQDWTFKTSLRPEIYQHNQIRAYMDLQYQQIEALLLNSAYWVYDLYSDPKTKDNWNDENASLLGPDRQPRNTDIVARVYPMRSSAEPEFLSFDISTKHAVIVLKGKPVAAPTVIFIPAAMHYPDGFEVRATSPAIQWDANSQLLYWQPDPDHDEHIIVISPSHNFKQSSVPDAVRQHACKTIYYWNSTDA